MAQQNGHNQINTNVIIQMFIIKHLLNIEAQLLF